MTQRETPVITLFYRQGAVRQAERDNDSLSDDRGTSKHELRKAHEFYGGNEK